MNPDTARHTSLDRIDTLFAAQAPVALRLRHRGAAERLARLQALQQGLMDRREALLQACAEDLGKPAVEVDLTELLPVVDEIRHVRRHLRRWMKPQRAAPSLTTLGTRARIVCQPRGRCLIIGPWNYPVSTLIGPLVSAVAAGNTAVLKPSEFTPRVNAVLAALVAEVFPEDEVAVVEGAVDASTRLLALPFDHIFFTGSPAVGQVVMAAAARHLASVTLELGGKSPVIIDASADLRGAAEHLMWGKFVNAGQTCVAPDHVWVHRSVRDAFVAECQAVLAQRFGADPAAVAASPDLARLVHERHAARVAGLLDEAVAGGARVLAGGGHDAAARFIAPTLIDQVPEQARIGQEEIFGPVLPIAVYDQLDTVIDRINAAPKPLALYLWSRERTVVDAVRAGTSSGSFCVNLCLQQFAHHHLPFGGVNHSGIGHAHGVYGFKAFSHERAELHGGPLSALKLLFPPYTAARQRLSRTLLAVIGRS